MSGSCGSPTTEAVSVRGDGNVHGTKFTSWIVGGGAGGLLTGSARHLDAFER